MMAEPPTTSAAMPIEGDELRRIQQRLRELGVHGAVVLCAGRVVQQIYPRGPEAYKTP